LAKRVSGLLHFPPKLERKAGDPAPADDDDKALKQSNWHWYSRSVEKCSYQEGQKEDDDQDAGSKRRNGPAFPVGIVRKASGEHKNGGGEEDEAGQAAQIVKNPVEGLNIALRSWWISKTWVRFVNISCVFPLAFVVFEDDRGDNHPITVNTKITRLMEYASNHMLAHYCHMLDGRSWQGVPTRRSMRTSGMLFFYFSRYCCTLR
jgi:hypothetical protein